MSKKKNTDTNVSEKKEDNFLANYIENQFTQKNTFVSQERTSQLTEDETSANETPKKKQYFA